MKVLLIHPPNPDTVLTEKRALQLIGKKGLIPPLGLLTVAALLPSEWDLKFVDAALGEIPPADLNACQLMMVTGTNYQEEQIIRIIEEGKKLGKTVIVGGPWSFHCSQEALKAGADLVVRGEAEVLGQVLLNKLNRREFGSVVQAENHAGMEMVPRPRFDLVPMNKYFVMPIQYSRGCPHRCAFCDVTYMFGRKVRSKKPTQFIEELEFLYHLGWRGYVFVVDDNFVAIPARTKALLRELIPWMHGRRTPFRFVTQSSISLAADDELLELMVQAGFERVCIGIESTDAETLERIGKHQNLKIDLEAACRKINRAGLVVIATCIIGLDGEKSGVDVSLAAFASRTHIPELYLAPLFVDPGTDLWHRLKYEGRLLPRSDARWGDLTRLVNFQTERPFEQIVREIINFNQLMYEPRSFLERVYRHLTAMKRISTGPSSIKLDLQEVVGVLIILFKQGVVYPSRWTFWKLLCKILKACPERLGLFFRYCGLGIHYDAFRKDLVKRLTDPQAKIAVP